MNPLKRLYNWILGWSESRWGALALFLLAFAESSFFPIPPDVLLIALCLGCAAKAFRYAAICTVGSLLGAVAGYAIGYFLWQTPSGEFTAIADFFFRIIPGFTHAEYDKISNLYNEYNFWVVFTLDLPMFVFASIVSRGLRFVLISWLIWKYGAPIKTFIDKYFNLLAIGFTVLLVGGFFAIKYAF